MSGSIREVRAIFDNGTNRVLPSLLLIAEGATIGDAVERFNANHARGVWKVASIELAGFVRESDMENRDATVWQAPATARLVDMLRPNDFLVFRATRPGGGDAAGARVVEAEMEEGETEAQHDISQIEESGPSEDTEDDSPTMMTDKPAVTQASGSGSDREQADEEEATSDGQPRTRLSSEVRQLTRGYIFPKNTILSAPRRTRNQTRFSIDQTGVSETSSTRERTSKRARTKGLQDQQKPAAASTSHHKQTKLTASKSSPSSDRFGVGTRHFYCDRDGMDYPVKVKPTKAILKPNERMIVFEGYRRARPIKVRTCLLLPVTPEREAAFVRGKELTAAHEKAKRQEQKMAEERRRQQKRAEREQAREDKERRIMEAQAKHDQYRRNVYGKRTPCQGPFPRCKEPGTLFEQEQRRVYFAEDDDTPLDIADKFGVSVGKIIYDNEFNLNGLKGTSRLEPLAVVVLPPEEEASDIDSSGDEASVGSFSELSASSDSDSLSD